MPFNDIHIPVERTHGPDRCNSGPRCSSVFLGQTRTGVIDWCCCCNPCNYIRPVNSAGRLTCRCHPRLMCVKFTPDETSHPCCRAFSYYMFPQYKINGDPKWVGYNFPINVTQDEHYSLRIENGHWRLYFVDVTSNETLLFSEVLDHTNVTCLGPPNIELSGFGTGYCTGTLTWAPLDMVTVPFGNPTWGAAPEDVRKDIVINSLTIPGGGSPCNCVVATDKLAVSGVRHVDGDWECVVFHWDEDLGDRWTYLPPGGDPSTDRETIYLRGDYEGNCWLELDFEQSGLWTNDWSDPPSSFNIATMEVLEGMIPIEDCGCCVKPLRSFSTGGRYVDIHAGLCSKWVYACGRCRCVPRTLCLFGSLNGIADIFFGDAVWDGEGWNAGSFRLYLAKNTEENCILRAEGIDLNDSEVVNCDFHISAEMFSDYNPYYTNGQNWLWINSSICGDCLTSLCTRCTDQCAAPPQTLYATITVYVHDGTAEDYIVDTCVYDVVLQFYQRWDLTNPTSPTVVCGYVGYTGTTNCDGNIFYYRVELLDFGSTPRVSRRFLAGPLFDLNGPLGGYTITDNMLINDEPFEMTGCDPWYQEGNFDVPGLNAGHCCQVNPEFVTAHMVVVE